MAEAILLGTSSLLLGSNRSSFTELAMPMTERPTKMEVSEVDF
jgi:hypothetical protein